jgi:hypothetical protein
MEKFGLLILFAVPIAVSGLILLFNKKDLTILMKRENSNYTGQVNNTIDVFRIYKTYKKSDTIDNYEKRQLRTALVLIGISWINAITLIVLFVFIR